MRRIGWQHAGESNGLRTVCYIQGFDGERRGCRGGPALEVLSKNCRKKSRLEAGVTK